MKTEHTEINATTFQYDGHTWNTHTPGDPCPCDRMKNVTVLYSDPIEAFSEEKFIPALCFDWLNTAGNSPIIGWRE